MAWAETFQPASFRGVRFEVERVAQQGSRSVAVHQVPFRNGAAVDDLGLLARRIGVRAHMGRQRDGAHIDRADRANGGAPLLAVRRVARKHGAARVHGR
jgi:hypothetical protein